MTKEKQIEEMARAIFNKCHCGLLEGEAEMIAEFVIDKQGYRKATDVAKEILTDRTLIDHLERACGAGGKLALSRINELKKEYEVTQC